MHPEDRYYPSYYADQITSSYQASRAHIDPYATLTPSERLRPYAQPGELDVASLFVEVEKRCQQCLAEVFVNVNFFFP